MAQLSPSAGDDEFTAIFKAGRNERMAGSVPVWDSTKSAKDEVLTTIAAADNPAGKTPVNTALSYADASRPAAETRYDKPFGFGDLVDMANPLQHIPVVGHVYRGLTGDEINPAARVIGASVYGGFLGGAAAMADVIVEHESGRGLTDTVAGLMRGEGIMSKKTPNTLLAAQEYAALHETGDRTAGFTKFKETGHQSPSAESRASTDKGTEQPHAPARQTDSNGPVIRKEPVKEPESRSSGQAPVTTINFSPLPPIVALHDKVADT